MICFVWLTRIGTVCGTRPQLNDTHLKQRYALSAGFAAFSRSPNHLAPLTREREWSLLTDLLSTLQNERRGAVALISGEAGIGKTALVEALAAEARAADMIVLSAASYDMEMSSPYSLWQELLQSARRYADLPAPPPGLDNLEDVSGMRELWDLIARHILEISRQSPMLLILEDIHWAEQSSVELLRYIARQVSSASILLLATYRDTDLIPAFPLYRLLPNLVRELRPVRLPLRPLGIEGARAIVADRFPSMSSAEAERLATYLNQHAEGNPLYIEEFIGLLEDTRSLRAEEGVWNLGELPEFAVPPLIRQIIEGRLEHLSDAARRALQIASAFGMDVPLDAWQRISATSDDQTTSALEEVLQTQILKETPEIDIVRFRHALVRDAIYWSTNILQRLQWHAQIGEELAEQPEADPGAIAHHFVQAEDERAADWLIETAQRAGRAFALQAMISDYSRALSILERTTERLSDHVAVLCALAEAHRFTDTTKALGYIRLAEDLAGDLDAQGIGVLASWVAARIRGFDDQPALNSLIAAATAFENLSPDEQNEIKSSPLGYVVSNATLSQDLAIYGVFGTAQDRAEQFLEQHVAPTSRSRYIEFGNAHFGLGIACAALGEPDRAQSAFEASRHYFRESGNFQMLSNCYYWELNTVMQIYYPDRPDIRHRLQIEEVQANLQSEFVQAETGERQDSTSDTLIFDGDWDACWRSANLRLDIPASRVPSARKLAEIEWLRGNRERAWEHIRRNLPAGPDEEPGRRFFIHRQELQWIAANLAIESGDESLARRWIAAFERWTAWSGRATGKSAAQLLQSRLYALVGDLHNAMDSARSALADAANPPQPLSQLQALRALGQLSLQAGDSKEAEKQLAEALVIARSFDAPHELALTLVAQAELEKYAGDEQHATTLLAEAKAIAERLGAQPLISQIEALDGASPETTETTSDVTLGLTPRQIEVLQLLARGMTDAEIAAALFISPRTVHGHLNAIYTKLDVESRTAAVAMAFAQGIVSA